MESRGPLMESRQKGGGYGYGALKLLALCFCSFLAGALFNDWLSLAMNGGTAPPGAFMMNPGRLVLQSSSQNNAPLCPPTACPVCMQCPQAPQCPGCPQCPVCQQQQQQQQQVPLPAVVSSQSGQAAISQADICDFQRKSSAKAHYDDTYFKFQIGQNKGNIGWQTDNLKTGGYFDKRRGVVMEVGCSAGYTLGSLKGVDEKHCIEIMPGAIKHGKSAHRDINYHTAFREVADGTVDYVYSFDSVEHHESPLDTLLCIYQKLRAGGEAFISVPFEHGAMGGVILDVYGRKYVPGDINNHLYTWNPLLLGNLMNAAGFKVKSCRDGEEWFRIIMGEGRQGAHGPREKMQIWCIGVKQ